MRLKDEEGPFWLAFLMLASTVAVWGFFGFAWAAVAASAWAVLGLVVAMVDGIKKG